MGEYKNIIVKSTQDTFCGFGLFAGVWNFRRRPSPRQSIAKSLNYKQIYGETNLMRKSGLSSMFNSTKQYSLLIKCRNLRYKQNLNLKSNCA